MTTTPAQVREMALRLPEAIEADHHGLPSFRVRGKIFATLREDPPRMMVKLDGEDQHNWSQAWPGVVEPVPGYWGRKGATFVALPGMKTPAVETLLALAWTNIAPKRLRGGA